MMDRPAASPAIPATPAPLRIGPRRFRVGRADVRHGHPQRHARLVLRRRPARGGRRGGRRRVASGPIATAVAMGRRMVDEGADLLDVGGESTRPGHAPVAAADEIARVVPIVAALRAALPDTPLSIDTTKTAVAAAALDAGADLVNDVWGVASDDALASRRGRARRPDRADAQPGGGALHGPHGRGRGRPPEQRSSGPWPSASPGSRSSSTRASGSARPPPTTSSSLRDLADLRAARPADPARHLAQVDPRQGARPAARSATRGDARDDGARGSRPASTSSASTTSARTSAPRGWPTRSSAAARSTSRPSRRRPDLSDRIVLHNIQLQGRHGYYDHELEAPQPFEVDVELVAQPPAGRRRTTTSRSRSTTGAVYERHPPDRRVDVVPPARGARRGDQPRDPDRVPGRPRSASGSASRPSSWAARSTTPASRSGAAARRADPGRSGPSARTDGSAEVLRPRPERHDHA